MKDDRGLYDEFRVIRRDGQDGPDRKHDSCNYIVLDVDHDPDAAEVLRALTVIYRNSRPKYAIGLAALGDEVQKRLDNQPTALDEDMPR